MKIFNFIKMKMNAQNCAYMIGIMYCKGYGVFRNPTKAAKWFEKAAGQGHAEAQYKLGMMYYVGKGVPPSPDDAMNWLGKAAAQGHVQAQSQIPDVQAWLGLCQMNSINCRMNSSIPLVFC